MSHQLLLHFVLVVAKIIFSPPSKNQAAALYDFLGEILHETGSYFKVYKTGISMYVNTTTRRVPVLTVQCILKIRLLYETGFNTKHYS